MICSWLFIMDQNIFDGLMVASKVVDEMRRHGEGFLLKVNFDKAYEC